MRDEKAYYLANRDHKLALAKKRYQEKREEILEYHRLYRNTPEHKLVKRLRRYGISHEEYIAFLESQGSRCAVCRNPFLKEPHIDHDHETSRVRGLLCGHCNAILGYARDNPEILDRAKEYLQFASVID